MLERLGHAQDKDAGAQQRRPSPIRKFAAAVGIPCVETGDLKSGIFALAFTKMWGLMVENEENFAKRMASDAVPHKNDF
jgi:hypothetical protein